MGYPLPAELGEGSPPVMGPGAFVVVERDFTSGQGADAVEQVGVVLLHDGDAVGFP